MKASLRIGSLSLLACLSTPFLLAGCGGDGDSVFGPGGGGGGGGGGNTGGLVLEEFGVPRVQYDPAVGTTTVVVQVVARGKGGEPLGNSELDFTLLIDGRAIDVEGLLSEDSEVLATNLHVTLLLDASYSMLQHSPPAFAPMLAAARSTLDAGRQLYAGRPGVFDWDLFWFADRIYTPLEETAAENWVEADIERIPTPGPGTFTRLFSAAQIAAERAVARAEIRGSGPRDQHLVVVFSDGADNYSWFDNSQLVGQGTIATSRRYRYFGTAPVGRPAVEQYLQAHPEIQLFTMGLGSAVNDAELQGLATAGRGRYFKNTDSNGVDALFARVVREFTSVQTRGATVPLPPGDYEFSVRARRKSDGSLTNYRFRFRGGETGARVLP